MNDLLNTIASVKANIKTCIAKGDYKNADNFNNILTTIIGLMRGGYTYDVGKCTDYLAAAIIDKTNNRIDNAVINFNFAKFYYNISEV